MSSELNASTLIVKIIRWSGTPFLVHQLTVEGDEDEDSATFYWLFDSAECSDKNIV